MIKNLARLTCLLFLLTVTVSGIAQSKPAPKAKPAASTKKPVKPVEEKEIKIGAQPGEDQKPPEVEELEKTVMPPPELPPLPEIDTVAAPNDELTKEIKKLLEVTNAFTASKNLMLKMITMQRKNNTSGLPDEYYVRMQASIENGQVIGYLENVVVKIYRQTFTLEDIKGALKFYDTPIGRKMAASVVPTMEASSTECEKIGQYLALKIFGDLIKEGKWK